MSVWRKMHPLYSAAVTSFLNFRQYFPALISHPPVQKVFFLALERRRRRRDKSNQLNRLLPRGEAGYESDFSLFTGFVAAPLDIYLLQLSVIYSFAKNQLRPG